MALLMRTTCVLKSAAGTVVSLNKWKKPIRSHKKMLYCFTYAELDVAIILLSSLCVENYQLSI